MGGIESLIGITDVTQVVTLFLFGTKYKFVLWQLSILVGLIALFINAILYKGIPRTFVTAFGSFFTAVITAPIIEEIVFRLVLLTVIFYFTGSAALAIFLSAAIFGLAHMAYGAKTFPPTFVGGLILGVMFVNFGLISAIIVHITHNFFSMAGR